MRCGSCEHPGCCIYCQYADRGVFDEAAARVRRHRDHRTRSGGRSHHRDRRRHGGRRRGGRVDDAPQSPHAARCHFAPAPGDRRRTRPLAAALWRDSPDPPAAGRRRAPHRTQRPLRLCLSPGRVRARGNPVRGRGRLLPHAVEAPLRPARSARPRLAGRAPRSRLGNPPPGAARRAGALPALAGVPPGAQRRAYRNGNPRPARAGPFCRLGSIPHCSTGCRTSRASTCCAGGRERFM